MAVGEAGSRFVLDVVACPNVCVSAVSEATVVSLLGGDHPLVRLGQHLGSLGGDGGGLCRGADVLRFGGILRVAFSSGVFGGRLLHGLLPGGPYKVRPKGRHVYSIVDEKAEELRCLRHFPPVVGEVGEHAHEEFVYRCSVGECHPFVREVGGSDLLECFRFKLREHKLLCIHECVRLCKVEEEVHEDDDITQIEVGGLP